MYKVINGVRKETSQVIDSKIKNPNPDKTVFAYDLCKYIVTFAVYTV